MADKRFDGQRITGAQMCAARALLGWTQQDLANAGRVRVETIRRMEGFGAQAIGGRQPTVDRILRAIDKAGVEFLNAKQPGVRLKK